ncbi:MAG: DUF58 domain-containing protein [Candidatus Eremiobacteraeota bacterium]|nr:DUF58 domain-containing protein [Candidatus Eremiobacteraeota bacterium]
MSPRLVWALAAVAATFLAAGAFAYLGILAGAALAALTLAVALDALAGPRADRIGVERVALPHFSLRVRGQVRYRITNRSQRLLSIGLLEAPVRVLQFEEDELHAAVPPQSVLEIQRTVLPLARGEAVFGNAYLWFENRIGLLRRRVRIDLAQTARVYPDLSMVERYGSLHVRNRLIDAGLRKMRLRGAGTEFESLREFGAGDAFAAVDWKATARRGKLMVAQHEAERSQNIMLLLDSGRLMTPRIGEQRKFDYAVTAALSVATIAGLAIDRVGFAAFANELLFTAAPRPSRIALAQGSEQLYDLEPRFEESDYSRAFSYVRAHLHKRSLVILFTDMFDPVASTMVLSEIRMLARRHLVVCVFMNDAAIGSALQTIAQTTLDVYRAGIAAALADERRVAKTELAKLGVRIVDVPAAKLSVALIDAYLDIKARAAL